MLKEYSDYFDSMSGYGLMRALKVKSSKLRDDIVNSAFKNRLLVLKAGEKSLRFLPPLTISKEEVDKGFDRLKITLNEMEDR